MGFAQDQGSKNQNWSAFKCCWILKFLKIHDRLESRNIFKNHRLTRIRTIFQNLSDQDIFSEIMDHLGPKSGSQRSLIDPDLVR